MGPYAYNGNQWVGYDDISMAATKAQYILDNGLGGGMFWDLPSDDFKNLCGDGTYPIIRTVHGILSSGSTCGELRIICKYLVNLQFSIIRISNF